MTEVFRRPSRDERNQSHDWGCGVLQVKNTSGSCERGVQEAFQRWEEAKSWLGGGRGCCKRRTLMVHVKEGFDRPCKSNSWPRCVCGNGEGLQNHKTSGGTIIKILGKQWGRGARHFSRGKTLKKSSVFTTSGGKTLKKSSFLTTLYRKITILSWFHWGGQDKIGGGPLAPLVHPWCRHCSKQGFTTGQWKKSVICTSVSPVSNSGNHWTRRCDLVKLFYVDITNEMQLTSSVFNYCKPFLQASHKKVKLPLLTVQTHWWREKTALVANLGSIRATLKCVITYSQNYARLVNSLQ